MAVSVLSIPAGSQGVNAEFTAPGNMTQSVEQMVIRITTLAS